MTFSDSYLMRSVGLVTLCVHRVPEDGIPVPKHDGVMLIKYCVLYFINCIFGQYI